jgi:ATP-dependent RNA helicase DHR2
MKQFRTRLGLDSLLVKPISKSAAIQRKGRAGREAPGQCYRLYTEKDYLTLQDVATPEILRCDLSQAILTMKANGIDDIAGFPFLTRPSRDALEKALLQLFNLQALAETGKISPIGQQMARLPLSAPLGRVLLAGAENGANCLQDVIDIISCLSVENIFLNTTSEERKEEAEKARRDLFRREGDHLTMLATVRAYAAETSDRKAWAERHLVSHRAMQAVMVYTHFVPPLSSLSTLFSVNKVNDNIKEERERNKIQQGKQTDWLRLCTNKQSFRTSESN